MLGRPHNPPATVVGNGVAGYACARRLAELGRAVTLVGPGLPCDRPPLSKRALLDGRPPYLDDAAGMRARGIVRVDDMVTGWDAGRRVLTMEGDGELEAPGPLVWATGLRITAPPVPGAGLAGCTATAGGLLHAAPRLRRPGRAVVVVGAGLIGCETAATLALRHRVTLLELAERPVARMHTRVGEQVERALRDVGVMFLGGCGVSSIGEEGSGLAVATAGHGRIAADVVLAATGTAGTLVPGAAPAGARHLDTDERLRVAGADDTWACGDVARFPHPRFGPLAVPHWDNARATGEHAALAIAGGAPTRYARDPYWWSDVGRVRIQQVGHEEAVVEWRECDGLDVGLDPAGRPACVLVLDSPARMREARALLAA